MPGKIWFVAAYFNRFRVIEFTLGNLNILGKIHQNRSGTSTASDVESFLHRCRDILDITNQKAVFRAWAGDADNINFLKGIISDKRCWDLSGDDNHRN